MEIDLDEAAANPTERAPGDAINELQKRAAGADVSAAQSSLLKPATTINWRTMDDVPRDGLPVVMWHELGRSAVTVMHLDAATLAEMGADGSCPWCEIKGGEKRFWPDSIFSHWTRDFGIG